MNRDNYYAHYEKLSNELFEQLKFQYSKAIERARKPEEAHNLFIENIMKPQMGQVAAKMSELGTINNFRKKLEDTYWSDNTKERSEIFNSLIEEIEPSKREESIKLLAEQQADILMDEFWFNESDKLHGKTQVEIQPVIYPEIKSRLFWKAETETEFVQFAYALQKAGYLEHENKTITDLVEELACLFNFPLGKNWFINHSSSIHKRKLDTKREIFDNLKKSYEKYRDQQIDKKKRN